MRDLVLACVVFGGLPFILKRPFIGILMMAWLGYMNPHRLAWGFMMGMPVVQIVLMATLVGMVASKEAKRMLWTRETIVLLLFVAWMGITTTMAFYGDLAYPQYTKVLKIQVLTLLTLLMLNSKERVHLFIWIVVLSLAFYGVKGGIFTLAKGGSYRVQGPFGTFIGGNNELAMALVMTVPLMWYLFLHERSRWIKLGLKVSMFLTVVSAIGSQSRGALVALVITGTIFWLKGSQKFLTGTLIVLSATTVVALMPEHWWERMDTIKTYQEDESALGRINAWWTAVNVASDRVTGGGFEMFQKPTFARYAPEPFRVHDSHSVYFEVLGEHGFIGLFLFLLLLALTWFKCNSVIRIGKRNPEHAWAKDLATMVQVSLVAYMSGGAFLGMAYFDYVYHLIAVAVVVHALVARPRALGESVSSRPGLGLRESMRVALGR
jgi:putative inorganic carbon (hco3(-)) transporter